MAIKTCNSWTSRASDPAKFPVETRVTNFGEIYTQYDPQAGRPAGRAVSRVRQSVLRVEMPFTLHSQLAEA